VGHSLEFPHYESNVQSGRHISDERVTGQLRRRIGIVGLTAYGVGTILGAGIYALIGQAAALAGYGLWLSFLLAALVAALTGLSYAELSTTFPRAAAEFEFVRRAFGSNRLAFLVGWILILSGTASASTVALGFSGYLNALVGLPVPIIALSLLLILSAINVVGIRESTTVNIILTLVEAGGLLLVIVAAAGAGKVAIPARPIQSWPGIFEAAAFVFFAYLGFEDIANVAEETIAPERMIPIAILLSVVLTAVLYVAVAVAALALSSPSTLVASSAPLADALATVWGERGRQVLGVIALFATANTVLLILIAGTRMIYGMARAGVLPTVFGTVLPSTGTPGVAIIFQGLAAAAFLPVGGIGALGSLASWAALTAFISVNAALLWLRRTQPELRRPFRVPLSLGWVSLPALIGLLTALLASLYVTPEIIAVGIVATLIGLPVYEIARRQASESEDGRREGC